MLDSCFLHDENGIYQNIINIYGKKEIVQCSRHEHAVVYSAKELPAVKKYFAEKGITVFEKQYIRTRGRHRLWE